ncbi:hypothetical protein LDK59_02970 [Melissococcus plutonius]|uniref:hypothetical protein n=2 Tax=Melissococcus plutonius TaxID=33970 RepID=UPI0021E5CA80|nr:hypothetical protein [Melissococcus plutonius]MCV2519429.1 hypothetical protein [Melissococcus plutonius]
MKSYERQATITLKEGLTAEITLSFAPTIISWEIEHGWDNCTVQLIKDGKRLGREFSDSSRTYKVGTVGQMSYDVKIYEDLQRLGLADDTEILTIGKAYIQGDVHAIAKKLNETIKRMYAEVEAEAGEKTDSTKEMERDAKGELDRLNNIIETAEKEGIENLMNESEKRVYLRVYNNAQNEGGEGYIPRIVSREQYEAALVDLAKLQEQSI